MHACRSTLEDPTVRVFTPSKPASPTPMVVMLHGCTQDANGFADAVLMDDLAEANGFVVVYPEQPSSVTPTRCWQWWDPAHQARDAGEPKELTEAVGAIATAKGVDTERVYVAGISAGGAMSSVLAATYPDRFAAIGVVAGLEYKAATSLGGVLDASSKGGPEPIAQGDLVHAGMGTRARVVPAIVFQGTSDSVVAKVNGDQVAALWRQVAVRTLGDAAIETVPSAKAEAGYPFTWTNHRSTQNGASIVELYVIDGLGHAWPGGKAGGSYSDPKGPETSKLLWSFFEGRTIAKPLDVPPPAVPGAAPSDPGIGSSGTPGGSSGATSSSGNGAPAATSPSSDDSGCAVGASDRRTLSPAWLAVGLALIARARRRVTSESRSR